MKRSFIYLFALLAASTLAVSCQKDELPEAVASTFSRLSPFKGEVISDNASKTTLTNENQVHWEANDKVKINGTTYAASPHNDDATMADFLGDPETPDPRPFEGYYYAFFPASHYDDGVTGIMPDESTYNPDKFDLPMYAKSSSTTLQFYNTFADFRLKLKGTAQINCIVVESLGGTALTGPYTVNESNNAAVMSGTHDTNKVFTLKCNNTDLTLDGVTFHIPLPAGHHTLRFRIVTSEGYVYERDTKEDVSISASKYYTVEMTPVFAGTFAISETEKVRFASGNLKKVGSQYTFAGPFDYPTENTSTNQNFFTWNDAASANNVSNLFTVDGESYRVLSKAEWEYVMGFSAQKRPGTTVGDKTDARFVKVYVSGRDKGKGLLLIPDGFNWPSVVMAPTSTKINSTSDKFTTQYTQDKIQTLINAGCVFLPAAGLWDGSDTPYSGNNGFYWSTTVYASDIRYAYFLSLLAEDCSMKSNDRTSDRSLRLVQVLN